MEHAGFILGGYALTFTVVASVAWRVVHAGRRHGAHLPDDDKYWT